MLGSPLAPKYSKEVFFGIKVVSEDCPYFEGHRRYYWKERNVSVQLLVDLNRESIETHVYFPRWTKVDGLKARKWMEKSKVGKAILDRHGIDNYEYFY